MATITLNPCDVYASVNSTVLTNDNLTLTCIVNVLLGATRGTIGQSTGKFYYEMRLDVFSIGNTLFAFGLAPLSATLPTFATEAQDLISVLWGSGFSGTTVNSSIWVNSVEVLHDSAVVQISQGHYLCFAVDLDNMRLWVREDGGLWNASAAADPATNVGGFDLSAIGVPMAPYAQVNIFDTVTFNFGATAFAFTAPAGFFAGWSDAGGTGGIHIPRDVTATGTSTSAVTLTWTPPPGPAPDNYTVSYRIDPSGSWTAVTFVTGSPYAVTGLLSGPTYDFRVQAFYTSLDSCGFSQTVSQKTLPLVVKVLLPPAELQFCDADGDPFAGGTLAMYVPGTTTPKDTWSDPAGTVLNSNPIVLDSAGRALIYGDGAYRTILRDAAGNLIWDQPSFTYISAAMVPVVGAADLATARQAMGVTDAINAEATLRANADAAETARAEAAEALLQSHIDTIALTPGPPGATGPAGAAGSTVVQAGSGSTDASGAVTINFPTPFTAVSGVVACSTSPKWWAAVTHYDNAGFTVITTSPLAGGSWQSGPIGFTWIARGT